MVGPAYLVGAGGIAGAVLRHLVGQFVESESFPAGTLTVNVVGSFALGVVTSLSVGDELLLLVGTGACGAFTTFSSFAVDTVELWEADRRVASVGYAAANLLGALLAVGVASVVVRGL